MQVRPIQEGDIEQVIQLFRLNYGDDYSMPEFYDPQWVKRGIYSDHIVWLVIEDAGTLEASGAVILNFGNYNDLIGEIGRVVVDPSTSGKGLGGTLIKALIDASGQRVEFAFAEARTVHPKTQKINEHLGLMPLGFLPMYYRMKTRESFVFAGLLCGIGRELRRSGAAEVIPAVAPLAQLSFQNLELNEPLTIREDARAYAFDQGIKVAPLTAAGLVRVLKMETGRNLETEIFSGIHIDEGIPQLEARKVTYLVAAEGERTLGAIGYTFEEHDQRVRIVDLIAPENSVKGSLLRQVVDTAEQVHEAQVIECDVSAASPRMQQTLFEMGFLPTGYVPGMYFDKTARADVVKMAKLNAPWDVGALQLTDKSREYFEIVAPAFERASAERAAKLPALRAPVLKGFTPLEAYIFQRACEETTPAPGTELRADALHIPLSGAVRVAGQVFGVGTSVGASALLGKTNGVRMIADENTRVLTLTPERLAHLCEQHPRLGVKLYQNLAGARE